MQTLILMRNSLDLNSFERFEVESALEHLTTLFDTFPATARLYHNHVAQSCDVTPSPGSREQIERLKTLDGTIYCVVYPAGIEWIIIGIVAVIAIAAATYLLTVPQIAHTGQQAASSPNNNLSARNNQARPNGRIPDIYGTVNATPDLIAVPYKIFDTKSVEIEISYMCVGRGYYDCVSIKDGDTLCSEIEGTSVAVYDPFTSPNFGSPVVQIGDAITDALINVKQISGVNGQTLPAPNLGLFTFTTTSFVAKTTGGHQIAKGDGGELPDMRNFASAGDEIKFTNFAPGGLDLDGIYRVPGKAPWLPVEGGAGSEMGINFMKLFEPQFVNPNWASVNNISSDSAFTIENLTQETAQWIGPFTIDMPTLTTVICNFVALGGLYSVNTSGQRFSLDIQVEVELTPIDINGNAIGAAELFTTTLSGSTVNTSQIGVTLYCTPAFTGRCKVRVHRLTDHDYAFTGTVQEEVKVREIYGAAPITETDFGNVTTIYARSLGTTSALSVKERKLNLLATRKLQLRLSGTTFDSAWAATQSADEILAAAALDQFIGNRTVSELDLDTIYSTVAEVKAYFGTNEAGQFNYTFDKTDLSFEDTVATIAGAIFSTAYRRGSIVTLAFERETPDSSLLFNHRNKYPKSETRSISFGNQNDYDGVWLSYISAVDGAKLTYYIPSDQSSVNPKKIDTIGVTSFLQAYFMAWRAWNKIRYQNTAVAFTAMQEANKLIVTERILVADNTRQQTQDGEVWAQDTLELTLSQDVNLAGDTFSIFLQHYDGTVESIAIVGGSAANKVVLATAPRLPLAIDDDNFSLPTFVIVGSSSPRSIACLVTEKNPQDNYSVELTAANYDARFYQNDLDHINLLV